MALEGNLRPKPGECRDKLVGQIDDGDFAKIDALSLHQIEQHVDRTGKRLERDVRRNAAAAGWVFGRRGHYVLNGARRLAHGEAIRRRFLPEAVAAARSFRAGPGRALEADKVLAAVTVPVSPAARS